MSDKVMAEDYAAALAEYRRTLRDFPQPFSDRERALAARLAEKAADMRREMAATVASLNMSMTGARKLMLDGDAKGGLAQLTLGIELSRAALALLTGEIEAEGGAPGEVQH